MSLAAFLDIICPNKYAFMKETWSQGNPTLHWRMFAAISNVVRSQKSDVILSILKTGAWMDSLQPHFDADKQSATY